MMMPYLMLVGHALIWYRRPRPNLRVPSKVSLGLQEQCQIDGRCVCRHRSLPLTHCILVVTHMRLTWSAAAHCDPCPQACFLEKGLQRT